MWTTIFRLNQSHQLMWCNKNILLPKNVLELCCLSGMFVCDCLHIACVNCDVCDQNYFLRNILPILIPIQPKQMTTPRNSNIKNGDNNNQEMDMLEQLLANQTQLNQVTTQFLLNNIELDATMQRMTNQMINMKDNLSQGNHDLIQEETPKNDGMTSSKPYSWTTIFS